MDIRINHEDVMEALVDAGYYFDQAQYTYLRRKMETVLNARAEKLVDLLREDAELKAQMEELASPAIRGLPGATWEE